MITGMGLSGQPNEGADIGGFAGPAPDEELFVRWVQSGIFQPRFSIHSASSDNTVTEPWMFSASKDRIRKLIDLRYRLMPYLYSLEYEAHLTGAPVMRALVYEFQGDESVFDESFEFMSGKDLLVANVLEPGAKTGKVYLPAGCRWFDANDRFRAYEGGQSIEVPVTLDTIPLFVRDGAIIPYYGETENTLELLLAPGRDSSFTLYDDDGVTNGFEKGVFRKTNIEMSGDESVKVLFRAEGTYKDSIENIHIEMIKKERCPYRVALDGRKLEHFLSRTEFEKASEGRYYSSSKRSALIKYDNPKKDAELLVSFEDLDLIGM
jgi:alpha-glucosidase